MNILFVVKEFPHSRVIGGPIIIYNRVKYLARDHTVSVVAFDPQRATPDQVESTRRYCHDLSLVPAPTRGGAIRRLEQFFAGPVPPYFMLNYSEEMYAAIRRMVGAFSYDVVISEYSMVAQYLYRNPDLAGVKRVMSVHECYYLARRKTFSVQGFNRESIKALLQLKGLKRFEFDMYADADKVLTLTPEGRDELLDYQARIGYRRGAARRRHRGVPPTRKREGARPTVMFLGNYPHDPNRDAVIFFATEVWPTIKKKIPGSRFLVVGRGPTRDMLELAKRYPSIEITGEVEDVRSYFRDSDVFVCPVRLGGGFRGKILEAMASGVPVVSTGLGAEGVPARTGENILLADTPEEFAGAAVRLLEDEGLRNRIATNARKLVVENFSWQRGVEILSEVLEQVVGADKA